MHRPLRILFGVGFLGAMVLGAARGQDKEKKTEPAVKLNPAEAALVNMINQVRSREKLPALKPNEKLFEAARNHSANMAKQGKLAHDLDDKGYIERAKAAGYDKAEINESLAGGPNLAPNMTLPIWGKLPHDRDNILSDKHDEIGIGVARDRKGVVYYTVLFGGAGTSKSDPELGLDRLADESQKILELTNKERAKEKLPPLKFNATLGKTAQGHSINMAKQLKLAHELDGKTPQDRIKEAGYRYQTAGENCAVSFTLDLDKIVEGWMNSPPHRANILNPKYTEIGIALARSDKGDYYATQVFATPR
ncbi:MAG: CAP domain-containing protein [Gemmataceae bacterium]